MNSSRIWHIRKTATGTGHSGQRIQRSGESLKMKIIWATGWPEVDRKDLVSDM